MKKILLPFIILFSSFHLFSQNHPPTAVPDIVMAPRGFVEFDPLLNDYDVDGDHIRVFMISIQAKHGYAEKINDSTIQYTANPSYTGGTDTLGYMLRDNGVPVMSDTGWVYVIAGNSLTIDSVNINDIDAAVNANGQLFSEVTRAFFRPVFLSPKNSEKATMFCGNLWVAGKDSLDSLHIAAPRYSNSGYSGNWGCDYWAGPVSNVYNANYDYTWNRLWKVTKIEIENHIDSTGISGYTPPQSILDWPGNGNISQGQAATIAPFVDVDSDGYYNPYAGDYPLIKGDEAVFFVFNDDRGVHAESHGDKLKIEVHGMLYDYECDKSDAAYYNTVFLHYDIINRSQNIYHDTYVGEFIDFDIGDWQDDFDGCDVSRSMFYGYNADNIDGTGLPNEYGAFPPAQGVMLIKGPLMDADSIDNPTGLCDFGVNGTGFGDSIIDNERMGLTNFIFGWDCYSWPYGPTSADTVFYNIMRSINKYGPMQYGGVGSLGCNAYGPTCRFQFPGTTDSCNWGTGGNIPNGPADWTEITANDNIGSDRNCAGSSGPFTFKPGNVQSLDYAFIFAQNFSDSASTAAIPLLQDYADTVKKYFSMNMNPCNENHTGIPTIPAVIKQINIYPNPADDFITIETSGMTGSLQVEVYNIIGEKIYQSKIQSSTKKYIPTSQFKPGLYFIDISDGTNKFNKKFIKL